MFNAYKYVCRYVSRTEMYDRTIVRSYSAMFERLMRKLCGDEILINVALCSTLVEL